MEGFYYFGYASNLDVATLSGRLLLPPKLIGVGLLQHHGFRFNFLNPDSSARANIMESPNETVYGLVYWIDATDRQYFLKSEPGYDFVEKEILTKNGKIQAFTFQSGLVQSGIFPAEDYWKLIVKGGKENGIPESYLAQIINRAGKIQSS
jgi:hypothetical protein